MSKSKNSEFHTFCVSEIMRLSGLDGFPQHGEGILELVKIIEERGMGDRSKVIIVVNKCAEEIRCVKPAQLRAMWSQEFPPPRYEPCAICAGHTGWQIVLRQQPSGEVHSGAKRCPCGAIPNMAQATAEERSHEGQMSAAESAAFEESNMAFMRRALAKVRRLPRGHAVDPVAQLAIGEYREKRATGELEGE